MNYKLLLLIAAIPQMVWATKLSDYSPYRYEVFFTNPECKTYAYDSPIPSDSGKERLQKTQNAYCKPSDVRRNAKTPLSPLYQINKLLNDSKTKEVFLSFLSFSSNPVAKTLCKNMQERGLKVTFIMDSRNEERATEGALRQYYRLKNCLSKDSDSPAPTLMFRGNESGLGFAHNKVIIANPKDRKSIKIVYGSGNMSSGTVIHHENWHFVTTSPKSYFAQVHLCLMRGMIDHGQSKAEYKDYIAKCRKSISTPEEEDIKVYIVPGEGNQAMTQILKTLGKSKSVWMAAHRFSHKNLINQLASFLDNDGKLRLVLDDDLYWTKDLGQTVGRNTFHEVKKVNLLTGKGAKVKFVETNHDARLLHHNKFMIFNLPNKKGAVFAGAGNFTGSAFTKNFENFYYTTIPSVVKSFRAQYKHLWNDLATSSRDMPQDMVMP